MYLAPAFNSGPIGSNRPRTLTPRQRDEIGKRRYLGDSARELATEYGVRASYIYSISPIEN